MTWIDDKMSDAGKAQKTVTVWLDGGGQPITGRVMQASDNGFIELLITRSGGGGTVRRLVSTAAIVMAEIPEG